MKTSVLGEVAKATAEESAVGVTVTVFDVVVQKTLERTASNFGVFFPFLPFLPLMDIMLALLMDPSDPLDPLDFLDLLPANVSDVEDENLLKVSDSPLAATEVDKARPNRNASRNAVEIFMFFVCVSICVRRKKTKCVSKRRTKKEPT